MPTEETKNEFLVASVAQWSFSLPLGRFCVSCVFPLSAEDAEDILSLLKMVERRIQKSARAQEDR